MSEIPIFQFLLINAFKNIIVEIHFVKINKQKSLPNIAAAEFIFKTSIIIRKLLKYFGPKFPVIYGSGVSCLVWNYDLEQFQASYVPFLFFLELW